MATVLASIVGVSEMMTDRPRARRREPPGPADPLLRLRAGLLLRLLLPHRPRHPPPRAPLAGEAVTPHRPSPLLYLSCSAPEPSIQGARSVACPGPSGQARGRQPTNCLAGDPSHDLLPAPLGRASCRERGCQNR